MDYEIRQEQKRKIAGFHMVSFMGTHREAGF